MQQFWMVAGDGPTNQRHSTPERAEIEAARLARQNPGEEFFVMQAMVMHRKVDTERVVLDRAYLDDDLEPTL